MSNQPLLVTGGAVADASVDALLATAHALAREAANRVRSGTADTSREGLIDQAVACQQVQNSMWAAQSARLAQVAAIEEVVSSDGPPREVRHAVGSYADEWLPSEIGTRLGWSDRQATTRLTESVDAIRRTPRLFDLTARGALDPRKLVGVGDTLCGASSKVAEKVEDELLATFGDADDVVSATSTKLIRRSRRLLAQAAPADADKAAATRRADAKGVQVFPHHEPGLSVFRAVLPSEDAMRVMAGVNELARHLHRDTTTGKSLDDCRVDAFVDLVLGKVSVNTTCVVHVPVIPAGADGEAHRPTAGSAATDPREDHCSTNRWTATCGAGMERFGGFSSGGFACRPEWPPASFVEPQLEQLLRQAVQEGLDGLAKLDARGVQLRGGVPCNTGPTAAAAVGSSRLTRVRSARGVEIRERSMGSDASSSPGCPPGRRPVDAVRPAPGRRNKRSDRPPPTQSSDKFDRPRLPNEASDTYRLTDTVVEGLGVIPAGVLAEMCRTLGTKVTRALVDMQTGATIETADETYRPGARLRRFVVTRDEHCRFPGCTRPARLDDVDHVDRYPEGPTAAWNLQCLCRHHHRAKHEGGWKVSMTPDGVCTWTSPSGRQYVTHPAD